MKINLSLLLVSVFLLCACSSTPQAYPTLPPQASPSPAPTQPPCSEISAKPTPLPGMDSLFPGVGADEWTKGPADAAVTFIVYNDFQCLECNDHVLSVLAESYPKDVRLVYRHFPQPDRYDKAFLAAQAAEAAGVQGRFWDMHDILFAKQSEWVFLTPEQFTPWVISEAARFGMDPVRFEADFDDPAILSRIRKAVEAGKQAGIPVLPLLLLNGQVYGGPTEYNAFDQVVRLILLGRKQFAACPAMTIDPRKQYLATLKTVQGEIVIELYADKAPLAVNSFVFLTRHGWYDGVTFHRVIPGFVAQAGDPSGTGLGGPGYIFRNEIDPTLHFDKPGMVGMANSGPDTNGSQFFITFAAAPHLDGSYTIFGHVLSGMEVLAKITPRDPGKSNMLSDGDILISVTIEER